MSDHITNLLKLQAFDFEESGGQISEAQRTELRTSIPQPILAHYDRLVARGKKGVAIVRNQVCTGCHMRLPIGTINTLMQHQDIQLCDSCGRYLYLPDATEAPAAAPVAAETKPQAKPAAKRKRKAAVASAAAV
jgi:predicted  nucleic acid-binding Zn-ribbon protein